MNKTAEEVSKLSVNDRLAIMRTQMANERTLLSYSRTSIMLAATGATLLRLFWGEWFAFTGGWVLLVLAIAVSMTGFLRFFTMRRYLHSHY